MKNFFGQFLSKKEEPVVVAEITPELVPSEQKQERAPKTLEDVLAAKNKIGDLEIKKTELINQHRNSVEQLKNIGVDKKQVDSNRRSETFNDILNPIENEIKSIAEEISEIREDNNFTQKPTEILEKRIERLNELCYRNVKGFLSTESGKMFLDSVSKDSKEIIVIPDLDISTAVKYVNFIEDYCSRNKKREILDDAEYKAFRERDSKIKVLMGETDSKRIDIKNGDIK